MTKSSFPYYTLGLIVRGFGRGNKELGCPTANLDENTVTNLPSTIDQGVYYGWAQIKNQNEIYKMVTSIGTNPFYQGEKKTIEVHLMHSFPEDFYNQILKIILLGEIRKMTTFKSKQELTNAIENDMSIANRELDTDQCRRYLNDSFFKN